MNTYSTKNSLFTVLKSLLSSEKLLRKGGQEKSKKNIKKSKKLTNFLKKQEK